MIQMAKFPEKYDGELLEKFSAPLSEVMSDEQRERITGYLESIADLYGVIPVRKVYDILTQTLGEDITEDSFVKFMEWQRHSWHGHFSMITEDELFGYDDEEESDAEPFDRLLVPEVYIEFSEDYESLVESQADKPYYEITKEELLDYENLVEFPRNEYTEAATEFLMKVLGEDHETAEGHIHDMMIGLQMRGDYESALQDIRFSAPDFSTENAREFIPYFADVKNHLRLSVNRGFTPEELEKMNAENGTSYVTGYVKADEVTIDEEADRRAIEEATGRQDAFQRIRDAFESDLEADMMKHDDSAFARTLFGTPENTPVRVTKIGRNEPCPCGSGKKYKKCCGKGK